MMGITISDTSYESALQNILASRSDWSRDVQRLRRGWKPPELASNLGNTWCNWQESQNYEAERAVHVAMRGMRFGTQGERESTLEGDSSVGKNQSVRVQKSRDMYRYWKYDMCVMTREKWRGSRAILPCHLDGSTQGLEPRLLLQRFFDRRRSCPAASINRVTTTTFAFAIGKSTQSSSGTIL
jgi:hypothetical protein